VLWQHKPDPIMIWNLITCPCTTPPKNLIKIHSELSVYNNNKFYSPEINNIIKKTSDRLPESQLAINAGQLWYMHICICIYWIYTEKRTLQEWVSNLVRDRQTDKQMKRQTDGPQNITSLFGKGNKQAVVTATDCQLLLNGLPVTPLTASKLSNWYRVATK